MEDVTFDKIVEENSDRWMAYLRGSSAMQTEAARREADNEVTRQNHVKLHEPKSYDVRLKAEAAKTSKLRALRLAKEAADHAIVALIPPLKSKPRRRASAATI